MDLPIKRIGASLCGWPALSDYGAECWANGRNIARLYFLLGMLVASEEGIQMAMRRESVGRTPK